MSEDKKYLEFTIRGRIPIERGDVETAKSSLRKAALLVREEGKGDATVTFKIPRLTNLEM